MARIRTIKPEFWTDDTVTECSLSTRLLFIGIWNFADDAGNLDRSAKQIKARVFPVDAIDCEPLIQELLNHGLLTEYSVSNKKYLHIPGFATHQVINRPSKPVVPPPSDSLHVQGALTEPSVSPPSGREGKGKERNGKDCTAAAPPRALTVSRGSPVEWQLDFKLAYPKRNGDPNWVGAWRAANARMAEGHSPEAFISGARRYAAYIRQRGEEDTEFVQQASRFLGKGEGFLLPWTLPPPKETAMDRIYRATGGIDEGRVFDHEPTAITG
jgi:hypothetical protein